jgi:hypothetical protein
MKFQMQGPLSTELRLLHPEQRMFMARSPTSDFDPQETFGVVGLSIGPPIEFHALRAFGRERPWWPTDASKEDSRQY